MASPLEVIISRLLLPDTAAVNQATQDLKSLFKNSDTPVALCNVMCCSENPQVRQYAAVLLRRKITKKRHWHKCSNDIRNGIKMAVLKSLGSDPEKLVRNAVGQLAGTLARHELPRNQWPELLLHLKNAISSSTIKDREVGVFILSIIADTSAAQLQPFLKQLISLLSKCLHDQSSSVTLFYTIKALSALGCMVGSDELQMFQNLIPTVLQVIDQLVSSDEDKACEALQIFDELIECEVGVLAPHVKTLVEFCLHLGGNSSLGESIRVKAIMLVGSIAQLKKKTILKHKLVTQIIKVLFPIMCTSTEQDDGEDIPFDVAEYTSPLSVSAQVIDILALNLPPEKLFQPLMHYVEAAFQSQNPYDRKAAYIALAVSAEGCADYIRNKYLSHFVQCLYKGIIDQHICVVRASLFALGQFAEHLQPEIGNFANELLPLIIECLKNKTHFNENNKELHTTTKLFYALENFCDSLAERLVPFLPSILEQLFSALDSGPLRIEELAVSSIGVVADAVKEAILPYFDRILGYIKAILSKPHSTEVMAVQLQALDTLGLLARTVKKEGGLVFVTDSIQLGLTLLTNTDDPDIRRCTYGLFAALSTVIHEEMDPFLTTIMSHMIDSLKSAEGVVVQNSSNNPGIDPFSLFIDLSDEDEEEKDDTEIDLGVGDDVSDDTDNEDYENDYDGVGLDIENAYLKEKEDTCVSLKEIAQNTKAAFLPYLEKVSEQVSLLLEHPAGVVRKAAVEALCQFCCTANEVNGSTSDDIAAKEAIANMATGLLLKLTVIVREDKERSVATAALDSVNELIKNVGHLMFNDRNHIAIVVSVVKDVLQLKMACQDQVDDDSGGDDDSDDQEAEFDQMLIESAGEIVPSLAKVVRPGSKFTPYFAGILSIMISKAKRKMNVAEKSFFVGILAESVSAMREGIVPFISHLYPVFISLAQDEDGEVRSNSIFGLGVLVEFGGQALLSNYGAILQLLSNALSRETDLRVTDNICAAVARMIITNTDAVPMDDVFPVMVNYLPLRQDFEENVTIVKCMRHLLDVKHVEVFNQMPAILQVMAGISRTPQVDQETQVILDNFVREISISCASGFETVLRSVSSEIAEKLRYSANAHHS